MSILTGSGIAGTTSFSSGNTSTAGEEVLQQQQQLPLNHDFHGSKTTTVDSNINSTSTTQEHQPPPSAKKKRNLPGTPDPSAEVIALSPKTLMATNRFVCEICKKGFQRDQNLQLHRRGHNLPWKLKQRTTTEIRKRVYVCPEPSCVHHHPARALGDLTGIKKHFSRKHGEKKWKCNKCSKKYAVQSDWKAHSKTCGTREYKCDCGTIFSRRDSFITHRAFCDAIAEENNTKNQGGLMSNNINMHGPNLQGGQVSSELMITRSMPITNNNDNNNNKEAAAKNPSTRSTCDQFNDFDTKMSIPLTLVPPQHHQVATSPMTSVPKPLNMATRISMLSSSASSASTPSLFEVNHGQHQLLPTSLSGHLSATELLQKAAQMGAITMTSPTTTGMAPSTYDQLYGGRYVNHFMHMQQHKDRNNMAQDQTTSQNAQFFGVNNVGNNNMGMFGGLLVDHQNNGLLMKNMEYNNNGSSAFSPLHGSSGNIVNPNIKIGLGSNLSSGDTMTVDFLGIGREGGAINNGPADHNFHDHQQKQSLHDDQYQLRMQMQDLDDQFQQGGGGMENLMWIQN